MEIVLPIVLFFFVLNRLSQVQLPGGWKLGFAAVLAFVLSWLVMGVAERVIATVVEWPMWIYGLVLLLVLFAGGLGYFIGNRLTRKDDIY